ncbi:ATP-grasp domain-containing protein [Glycomyces albidus]|uniref:ATP-grasp domain-containing protein n=1 Tax=Glycomyces albidus TaxID=2656774 RepID=A0A6L5G730_9ACTN|nr:ATP-grasp domain-containing protein [Glycomyces albidus]MQM25459.1 ATP-grasp domain-containing protein [Glycomyces albidus]
MRRRVLLIGMGRVGRPYAKAARELGVDLAVLDHPASLKFARARGFLDDDQAGRPVLGTSTAAWYSALPEVLAAGEVHGVVAFGEPHVTAAALIADELGLPGPGLRAAAVSQDKALQRSLFARHGIAQPAALAPSDLDTAAMWAASRYPVIAKPADGTGSRGVRLVADETGLRDWHAANAGAPFLVEQYLEGPEYSLECVVQGGRLVWAEPTRKTTTEPPFYVELGHTVPAGLPDPGPARALAAAVAGAMGMRDGLMHLEFRLEDSGPHLMEVAVRTPGDRIFELHALAHGTDLFAAAIKVALGEDPGIRRTRSGAAAIRFPAAEPGVVTRIEGVPATRRLPEVADLEIDVAPGDRVHPTRSSRDRVAAVLLTAPDTDALERAVKTAADLLHIRTAPE